MYTVDQKDDIWMRAARRAAIQFSDAAHQKIELRSGEAAAQQWKNWYSDFFKVKSMKIIKNQAFLMVFYIKKC